MSSEDRTRSYGAPRGDRARRTRTEPQHSQRRAADEHPPPLEDAQARVGVDPPASGYGRTLLDRRLHAMTLFLARPFAVTISRGGSTDDRARRDRGSRRHRGG